MIQKLSKEDFLLSLKLAPRIVVELFIRNTERELLLLLRESEPFEGLWHLPGGFLLKGEMFDQCCMRLANEEIGLRLMMGAFTRIGYFEDLDGDPRGHLVHHIYSVDLGDSEVKIGDKTKFFVNLPEGIIPTHRKMIEEFGM